MADYKNAAAGCFKEAVCIDVDRVYDTCCDRDCLEDLRVYFTPRGQDIIDQALNVKARSAEIINVCIDVEPVTFNRGYYSCDITFYFLVHFDVYTAPRCHPIEVKGICYFDKKVILYGSEGNVQIYSSAMNTGEDDEQLPPSSNVPVCNVEVVDPVVLAATVCAGKHCCEPLRPLPANVCGRIGGEIAQPGPASNIVEVTLGLFTVIKLVRRVQVLIPVYDFCVPEQECPGSSDNPCELFRNLQFPVDEFFPPKEKEKKKNNVGGAGTGSCCSR